MPLTSADLDDLRAWWDARVESERAWHVDVAQFTPADHIDLDIPNPHAPPAWGARTADEMADALTSELTGLACAAERVPVMLKEISQLKELTAVPIVQLADLLTDCRIPENVDATAEYPNFGIYSFGRGAFAKQPISGLETSASTLYNVPSRAFVYSRLFAFEGAFALVPKKFNGWYVSNEYPAFSCDVNSILPEYLLALFRSPLTWQRLRGMSKGLGHRRQRVQPQRLMEVRVPLPSIGVQRLIADLQSQVDRATKASNVCQRELKYLVSAGLADTLPSSVIVSAVNGEL